MIVAVYIPAGVPAVVEVEDVDDEVLLEPQPRENRNINSIIGARTGRRLRLRIPNHADASNVNVHSRGTRPAGNVT